MLMDSGTFCTTLLWLQAEVAQACFSSDDIIAMITATPHYNSPMHMFVKYNYKVARMLSAASYILLVTGPRGQILACLYIYILCAVEYHIVQNYGGVKLW